MTAATPGPTLPRRLVDLAATRPTAVALQEKRYGIWHPIGWAEYAAHVRAFAHGLASRGVGRGDAVGVLGDNRPEWLIAELAAQCLGAAVVGIDPGSTRDEVLAALALAGARVVIAEDQEQIDKLLGLADRLPGLAHIIYYDPRGLAAYRDARLARFTDVAAAGRRDAEARPGWLDGEIAAGSPGDTAVLCTTPGARPGLARLSHAQLLAMADQLHRADPFAAGERHVSLLPLAWIGEQVLSVACGLAHGLALAFPEDAATQRGDLREIGPELMLATPRIWDELHADVQARIDDAGWLKRRAFDWACGVGEAVARSAQPGRRRSAVHRIADAAVLRPVRDHLGLARITRCYAGGALSPEVLRFFRAIGVNLTQIDPDGWLAAAEAPR